MVISSGEITMKDKSGKEITTQEFMSRWKNGMQAATPLQLSSINLFGYWIYYFDLSYNIIRWKGLNEVYPINNRFVRCKSLNHLHQEGSMRMTRYLYYRTTYIS